jgi:NAD(P)-dependent dehydrogenase (short-subunit alcohol dehydrogenase family)
MAKAPRSLAGLTVAITGGARGIGRATAQALLAQGARVAIGDIDQSLAESTASELGSGTVGLPLDVTDRESFAAFLDQTEQRLGPLDVLINNAGIMPVGPFVEETDATAKRMVDINLHGVIFGSKLALERFIPRRHGHLVNIASIAGKAAGPHVATYTATKHAVVGLSEAIRQEIAGSGIDLTVVMPVGVNTELYSGLQQLRGIKTPEPEDVADAIVEALQTGRYEVYVPKRMNATLRIGALLPLRARDALNRATGGHRAITAPDHAARAAYEARMKQTIDGAPSAAPAADTPPPAEPATAQPAASEPNGADTEPAAREKEAV